ncbi:sodium-dependent bicarbonate transport family permease [Synechococcus sp. CS-602]|uniref:sodium-dependent bicarbonate transport family permease n=1 Tax=unclassified Synechococcus TaxID=2626047 RepID=UPI0021A5D872|nr:MULTISPECIES: sodium-dependent bicarbonate transport family permease [unclassified Synechococcus]MCT0201438.1 sodium-dependent bicarbonate transport family permease [Synechococcus sp. CS-603]MCT0205989.1 sodium-dependent bicarbonate transport family permease [Synechococcus sp. CS-602]
MSDFFELFIKQLQSPTLGFLIGGIVVASFGSQLAIPDAIYKFITFFLLLKIGLSAGIGIRNSNLSEIILPALGAVLIGILIVVISQFTLARLPGIKFTDAIATGGLFGAVSGSTLAAVLPQLESANIQYETWSAALYPFMDIPALVTAIVVASVYTSRNSPDTSDEVEIWPIIKESLQSSAVTAMLLGVALGILTRPERVYEGFYDLLFRGFLSVLMIIMGMEAAQRMNELRKVAQWFAIYAFIAPLLHGFIGFGVGLLIHKLTGFSIGGAVVLAVIAASSSDISGPPTLRAGIPTANPSSYIGASTAIGTPVAIAIGIPLFMGLAEVMLGK